MSILSLSMTTLGPTWTAVGVEGTTKIGGIYSIISSHWKNWQPPAWNTRLTHSLKLNWSKHKHACIWKNAYRKVMTLVEHTVKVLLCGCSVPIDEGMTIWAIHFPCAWDNHCSKWEGGREGGGGGREWMTTFMWHPTTKFWRQKWCQNTPNMTIVVILSSNGREETSSDPLLPRIKVI
jgi:hypothetical protein